MENGKANSPPPIPYTYSTPTYFPLATLMEQMICPRESLLEMKPRNGIRIRQETAKKTRKRGKENGKMGNQMRQGASKENIL